MTDYAKLSQNVSKDARTYICMYKLIIHIPMYLVYQVINLGLQSADKYDEDYLSLYICDTIYTQL